MIVHEKLDYMDGLTLGVIISNPEGLTDIEVFEKIEPYEDPYWTSVMLAIEKLNRLGFVRAEKDDYKRHTYYPVLYKKKE